MEFKLHVTNTPHDRGVVVPTGSRKFPLLVRRTALANKLAGTINASLLTFHKIMYSFPWYISYRNLTLSPGTVPPPFCADLDCPRKILVHESAGSGCLN